MASEQPNLFGDLDDDNSLEATVRKEQALGGQMDRRRPTFSPEFDTPMAHHFADIRTKHMSPGDYDDLDDFDPDGFDEFGGEF